MIDTLATDKNYDLALELLSLLPVAPEFALLDEVIEDLLGLNGRHCDLREAIRWCRTHYGVMTGRRSFKVGMAPERWVTRRAIYIAKPYRKIARRAACEYLRLIGEMPELETRHGRQNHNGGTC